MIYLKSKDFNEILSITDKVDGLSVIDFFRLYAGEIIPNDIEAEKMATMMPSRMLQVAIPANAYYTLVSIADSKNVMALRNLLRCGESLNQRPPICFYPKYNVSTIYQSFTKGTANTILISNARGNASITISVIAGSDGTTIIDNAIGTTGENGSAIVNLTVPSTSTETEVILRTTQIVVGKSEFPNIPLKRDIVATEEIYYPVI